MDLLELYKDDIGEPKAANEPIMDSNLQLLSHELYDSEGFVLNPHTGLRWICGQQDSAGRYFYIYNYNKKTRVPRFFDNVDLYKEWLGRKREIRVTRNGYGHSERNVLQVTNAICDEMLKRSRDKNWVRPTKTKESVYAAIVKNRSEYGASQYPFVFDKRTTKYKVHPQCPSIDRPDSSVKCYDEKARVIFYIENLILNQYEIQDIYPYMKDMCTHFEAECAARGVNPLDQSSVLIRSPPASFDPDSHMSE